MLGPFSVRWPASVRDPAISSSAKRCGALGPLSDPARAMDERPLLHVRHDERTDRAVIALSDAHMAMMIPTRLDLITREQVSRWNIKPAGNSLHQLIAGNGITIHIAAAG